MAKTLAQLNKELARNITTQIIRLHAQPLQIEVNRMGVLQVFDNQETDVISTQVAQKWFEILVKTADTEAHRAIAFDCAWQDSNEAQALVGYGGSRTMHPKQ